MVAASAAIDQFDDGTAYRFRLVERVKVSALRHRLNPNARTRLEPHEVRLLCRLSDPLTLIGLRDRAMLYTLASSGCRISEVVALRRSDIVRQGDHRMMEVIGKGKHEPRRAPLSTEAYEAIQLWLDARLSVVSPLIFTRCGHRDDRNQAITASAAWRRVRLIADAAGLEYVKPHDFRRWVGTQIAEKHGLRVAQKVLGHVSVETTAAHYVLDDLASGLTEDLF
jgi:integrase